MDTLFASWKTSSLSWLAQEWTWTRHTINANSTTSTSISGTICPDWMLAGTITRVAPSLTGLFTFFAVSLTSVKSIATRLNNTTTKRASHGGLLKSALPCSPKDRAAEFHKLTTTRLLYLVVSQASSFVTLTSSMCKTIRLGRVQILPCGTSLRTKCRLCLTSSQTLSWPPTGRAARSSSTNMKEVLTSWRTWRPPTGAADEHELRRTMKKKLTYIHIRRNCVCLTRLTTLTCKTYKRKCKPVFEITWILNIQSQFEQG